MQKRISYLSLVSLAILVSVLAVALVYATPKSADAATYSAKKCGGGTVSLNADEFATFKYHNQTRKDRGLRALCVHPALMQAARNHSQDMIDRDYFSHDTRGSGRSAGQRITAAGYNWRTYGENIGYNSTPKAMHNAWMNSSGHRANILSRNFKEVGIGAVTGQFTNSQGQTFQTTMYTVDFGAR